VANLATLRKQKIKSNDFLLSPSPQTKKKKRFQKKFNPMFFFLLIFLFLGKKNCIWKKITKNKDLLMKKRRRET
jgi:hypothetical protein